MSQFFRLCPPLRVENLTRFITEVYANIRSCANSPARLYLHWIFDEHYTSALASAIYANS